MFNPIYKIRRPLPADRAKVVWNPTPHLLVIGAFRWRVLITRYGPQWWIWLMRPGAFKYSLLSWLQIIARHIALR
jgi:hypothetical protein